MKLNYSHFVELNNIVLLNLTKRFTGFGKTFLVVWKIRKTILPTSVKWLATNSWLPLMFKKCWVKLSSVEFTNCQLIIDSWIYIWENLAIFVRYSWDFSLKTKKILKTKKNILCFSWENRAKSFRTHSCLFVFSLFFYCK